MKALDLFNATDKAENILFFFRGGLSQEILVEFSNYMKAQYFHGKVSKKILSVFVELWQNIMHYSSERVCFDGKDIGSGIIIFSENANKYIITSGNQIQNIQVNKLLSKLSEYKGKSSEELKEIYMKLINQDPESDSKGAGLGFIDIARKCNGNFDFSITELNENYSFFELNVEILKG